MIPAGVLMKEKMSQPVLSNFSKKWKKIARMNLDNITIVLINRVEIQHFRRKYADYISI